MISALAQHVKPEQLAGSGDLARMKAVKAQAEQYLATAKEVESELGNLRKSMK